MSDPSLVMLDLMYDNVVAEYHRWQHNVIQLNNEPEIIRIWTLKFIHEITTIRMQFIDF